jgi:2-succinyl-5-enolpyruvyl-6-hydroxy-3-cyclohexene-1-carboxylate synthase
MPVLCDALSGLRRPAVPNCIACLDALVGADAPDLIVRIGPPPLTRSAYEWLGRQSCPQIVLGRGVAADHIASATAEIAAPDAAAIESLATALGRSDPAWLAMWLAREESARARLPVAGWDATAASAAVCAHPAFPLLWLASSMPVRDANLTLMPRPAAQRVLCNRGVNGIDGTIASFIGAVAVASGPGACLIGDLAALHDLNSLALAPLARGAVVVLNNRGGAIFDALPVAQVPGYRRLIRTDHAFGFAHAAAQFGLPYRRCASPADLTAALDAAAGDARLWLIECDLGDSDGVAAHRRLLAAMRS